MVSESVVDMARLQFAFTALYHFLFVPLTLGLSLVVAIMESVYVMTNKIVYRDMARFWGKLFAINFALGVTTGLTMEFQFGTTWAYYSHYVGDIFGVALAIEGLMAFFLESTLVGVFFFGWDRIGKGQHLAVTWLTALGANLSALWILTANAWMQYPIGAEFNVHMMRMELTDFAEVFLNPVAQVKFVHTVAAGYVTGAAFVLALSSYYLIKGRDVNFARRSFAVASGFGLAASLSVVVLGDETGYVVGQLQKMKLAAMEAEWETAPPPAGFTVFGIPDREARVTHYEVSIPWVLGLIARRSTNEEVTGIRELVTENEQRIREGLLAYALLDRVRAGNATPEETALFNRTKQHLGYSLLLKRYTPEVVDASEEQIKQAAADTVPNVPVLFWTFRIMVAIGFFLIVLFATAFYFSAKRVIENRQRFLRLALWSLPLPWIAIEFGWVVAEYGRQPWAIADVLPTRLATSTLNLSDLQTSMIGFVVFYTALAIVEVYLMVKYGRLGPSSLHTGRYHFETRGGAAQDMRTLGTREL